MDDKAAVDAAFDALLAESSIYSREPHDYDLFSHGFAAGREAREREIVATANKAILSLETALQLSATVPCDCDRSEQDICQGQCLGQSIWNAEYRARKLIRRITEGGSGTANE